MTPRQRTARAQGLLPPQVHLHVARVVLGRADQVDMNVQGHEGFGAGLQQAVAAHLAGQLPPTNHATPMDHMAAAVAGPVHAALTAATRS